LKIWIRPELLEAQLQHISDIRPTLWQRELDLPLGLYEVTSNRCAKKSWRHRDQVETVSADRSGHKCRLTSASDARRLRRVDLQAAVRWLVTAFIVQPSFPWQDEDGRGVWSETRL
jgi:hypothetical protein